MTTLGPSLAIVLSGALLTIAPWKTLMWVFAALVLIVLIAGAFVLYTVVELGRPVLDIASFILVAVALIGILYGVSAAFGGNIVISGGQSSSACCSCGHSSGAKIGLPTHLLISRLLKRQPSTAALP